MSTWNPLRASRWLSLAVALGLATAAATAQTNTYWRPLAIDPDIYDTPYRVSLFDPQNGEDGARAWSQTKWVFLYGFSVLGVLLALPESFTGWDTDSDIFDNWADNVSQGPVWDRDRWYINYLGHPYFGGIYYQVARKSGYRQWDAFVYTLLMSTFYWEYGIEAFAETPSIQDLVVHPLLGWVYGEWAFQTEQRIRADGNEVAGSQTLGSMALFLLDPIDSLGRGFNRITGRDYIDAGYGYLTYTAAPVDSQIDHRVYLNLSVPLGETGRDTERRAPQGAAMRQDPVDTGIVGIALGGGHAFPDSKWDVDNIPFAEISLGLYFTPRISLRFSYAQGETEDRTTQKEITYENYSLVAQCYLLPQRRIRPYLAAGLGEQMWDKDREDKTFQWNAGLGLHCRLHPKWALQADWLNYYSPSQDTHDQTLGARLVYRFGDGEHHAW